jgi:hypothetical protein
MCQSVLIMCPCRRDLRLRSSWRLWEWSLRTSVSLCANLCTYNSRQVFACFIATEKHSSLPTSTTHNNFTRFTCIYFAFHSIIFPSKRLAITCIHVRKSDFHITRMRTASTKQAPVTQQLLHDQYNIRNWKIGSHFQFL